MTEIRPPDCAEVTSWSRADYSDTWWPLCTLLEQEAMVMWTTVRSHLDQMKKQLMSGVKIFYETQHQKVTIILLNLKLVMFFWWFGRLLYNCSWYAADPEEAGSEVTWPHFLVILSTGELRKHSQTTLADGKRLLSYFVWIFTIFITRLIYI